MEIYHVEDKKFKKYGRVVKGIDFTGLVSALEQTPCPRMWYMWPVCLNWRPCL